MGELRKWRNKEGGMVEREEAGNDLARWSRVEPSGVHKVGLRSAFKTLNWRSLQGHAINLSPSTLFRAWWSGGKRTQDVEW